jgi:predicted RNA-binding protein YlqC (UPF0109 family)
VSTSGEYVDGDINTTADATYEDGDVNTADDDFDDDDDELEGAYEEGDINAVGASHESPSEFANRDVAGTPTAVLRFLARSLANEPEAVVVQTEGRRGAVRLSLHVAPEDMGRVIGRRGRTAQALRTLVGVAGARDGVQTTVDIVDD